MGTARLNNAEGEFAQGVKFLEQALKLDPEAIWIRESYAVTYLHMGDVVAAQDVLDAQAGVRAAQICILQFKGQEAAAAETAYAILDRSRSGVMPVAEICASAAIRNEALRTRQYERAIRVLEHQYGQHAGTLDEDDAAEISFTWGLPYAEVLVAKGERARGTQLARAVLGAIDRVVDHPTSLPNSLYWRALALAVIGDRDRAAEALQTVARRGFHLRVWMLDHQPAFEGLRNDPRYQDTVAQLREWDRKQAVMLAELRKAHEVPERSGQHLQ
jgi:tetratricopeptide (TPR) repeat protein